MSRSINADAFGAIPNITIFGLSGVERMYIDNSFIHKVIQLFILGSVLGGCGGGGGNGSAGGGAGDGGVTAVASYITDQQLGKFAGSWGYFVNASSVVNASASYRTLSTTGTANTYTYSDADMLTSGGRVGGGTWGMDPNPWSFYHLNNGWILSLNSGILVDNGNGSTVTYTPTGEASVQVGISKASLAGSAIVCFSPAGVVVTCASPGSYPPGAVAYHLGIVNGASDQFSLVGGAGSIVWLPITDATGADLTALPAVGDTFCDSNLGYAFQPITPAPLTGDNYKIFKSTACTSAAIATALAGTALGTVLINIQPTGDAVVANVLRVQSTAGSTLAWFNNTIYGLRTGKIWQGWIYPAGLTSNVTVKNKAAINAELTADGWNPLL